MLSSRFGRLDEADGRVRDDAAVQVIDESREPCSRLSVDDHDERDRYVRDERGYR